jgi:hypothetical protein
MSMADVAALSATDAAAAFKGRSDIRQAAFVEQGKLVLHLDSMKLKAGQSVYGLLTAQGVPEGSVNNARLCADVLKAVVIPGHLPESRFDSIVTFRIVRQSRRLLNGKAAIKLDPAALSAILADGNQAQIGSELDCLAEHGQTIAEREATLKAEEEQAAALAAATAAAEKLKAKKDAKAAKEAALAAAAVTTEPPVETPAPQTDATPEVETPAPEVDATPEAKPATTPPVETDPESPEETDAPVVVVDERKPAPALTVVPSAPTVEAILEEITTAANKAFQFTDPTDMEKIALILEQAAADLRACIPAVEKVA